MIVDCFIFKGERNKLFKTDLEIVGSYDNVIMLNETSILNPSFIFEAEYISFNYIQVSAFNRYYFVNNVISIRNNLWRVDCSVDVLYTYNGDILTSFVHIIRGGRNMYPNVNDKMNGVQPVPAYQTLRKLTTPFDKYEIGAGEDRYVAVVTTISKNAPNITIKEGSIDNNRYLNKPASIFKGANGFVTRWYMGLARLKTLADSISNNSEYASHILSIVVFPYYNLVPSEYRGTATMYLGDAYMENVTYIKENYDCINTNQYYIKLDRAYNDYRDYEPYFKYQLYLPFIGNVDISADALYKGINIEYCVNIIDGSLVYSITTKDRNNNYYQISTHETNIAIEIPVTTTNAQEIKRRLTENRATKGASAVTSLAMLIGGAALTATGVGSGIGSGMMIGGATGLVGSSVSLVAGEATIPSPSASSSGVGLEGQLSPYFPCSEIKLQCYKYEALIEPSNIARVCGYPCNYYGILTNYNPEDNDIIICDYVHIEYSNALASEKIMIENALKEGIIY